jgi:DNA-binding beta-propeller fold protein YncE
MNGHRAAAVLLAGLLAGCGSADTLPPAPEPAISPVLSVKPAGRVVAVGFMPEGVVVDPVSGLAAVSLRNPDQLALVDVRRARVTRRVPVPESARHLSLERPGGQLLVPAERAGALLLVRLPGGRVRRVAVGRFPHDAAASGGRVLVADEHGDSVTIVERGMTIAKLVAPAQPGGVAPLPGGRAAVVSVRARKLTLFDLAGRRALGSIDAGVGPTHVVAADGRLYVADTEGDAILGVRLEPRLQIQGRAGAAGSPYGIAADARRQRLWVTLTARNRLVEYRLGGPAPVRIASFATVRQPNSVAVDPRTGNALVTGRVDGRLQIVRPKR